MNISEAASFLWPLPFERALIEWQDIPTDHCPMKNAQAT